MGTRRLDRFVRVLINLGKVGGHPKLWNMLVLAAYLIVQRVAWVFKTESVIMPAFLDTIAGAGWLR